MLNGNIIFFSQFKQVNFSCMYKFQDATWIIVYRILMLMFGWISCPCSFVPKLVRGHKKIPRTMCSKQCSKTVVYRIYLKLFVTYMCCVQNGVQKLSCIEFISKCLLHVFKSYTLSASCLMHVSLLIVLVCVCVFYFVRKCSVHYVNKMYDVCVAK
jgi:hypothetical protein